MARLSEGRLIMKIRENSAVDSAVNSGIGKRVVLDGFRFDVNETRLKLAGKTCRACVTSRA